MQRRVFNPLKGRRVSKNNLSNRRISLSRGLKRYIYKNIKEWIDYQALETRFEDLSFEVKFGRRRGRLIDCYTRIESLPGEWVAIAWGRTPQEAFKNCINHLSSY